MSWYGRPWWIFFLYMTPTVMAVTAVFDFFLPQQKKVWILNLISLKITT